MAWQAGDSRDPIDMFHGTVSHLVDLGLAGIASFDARGVVCSRHGVLSSWLPEVGASCFDSPILSGLDDELETRRSAGIEPPRLVLPGIRLATMAALPRCDITITWSKSAAHHAVLTTMDQIERPIDQWVVQQKREQRILEEKIVVASRELERINENLRRFTSIAAHDLQAPLRQIGMLASVLSGVIASADVSPAAIECVGAIEACAARLTRMIKGLLDYARMTSDQLEFEPVDLAVTIAEVCQNLDHDIVARSASISVVDMPPITGSRVLLSNLFQNLVGNSLRYAAPGRPPRIEIAGLKTVSQIISVTDNGIGIAAPYADTIFDSFVRVPNRDIPDGVGLGLGIARRIAELHGWTLSLDRSFTGGARFVIDLNRPAFDP